MKLDRKTRAPGGPCEWLTPIRTCLSVVLWVIPPSLETGCTLDIGVNSCSDFCLRETLRNSLWLLSMSYQAVKIFYLSSSVFLCQALMSWKVLEEW